MHHALARADQISPLMLFSFATAPQTRICSSRNLRSSSGPASSNLGGTLTVALTNGIAAFSDLTLDRVGSVVLQAANTGFTTVTLPSVQVTASQLEVTTQPPSGVTAGTSFQVIVKATDGLGNVDQTFNGPVTLTLLDNPNSGTLGGTLTMNAVNGSLRYD